MTDDSVLPQTERRSLRYNFSALEIQDFSFKLANKSKQLNAAKEEKKSVMSQWNATINDIQAQINKLSNFVADGFEYREVDCAIEYHKPEQGKKTLIRQDTKEKIIEKMEPWEFNLFSQVGADDGIGEGRLAAEKPPEWAKSYQQVTTKPIEFDETRPGYEFDPPETLKSKTEQTSSTKKPRRSRKRDISAQLPLETDEGEMIDPPAYPSAATIDDPNDLPFL